ncbi:MAG: ribosomal protein S5-alanine N-acetyltransferase [Luteibacter sp.]|uniref:ribosomal protein S5-alanine N-acetyltransferase n=1 Tax=Luteibacter sp. TaxID=1886636 RepID=UPI002809C839|nr:ribosomal protein S5-alanine N-acetyltransferase [Luteibacter sp.]MDQ7995996.1 ribosomal protein S5-alanine N-acetyltransferase [Luteibacter sp.]MDQ8048761.1 ribosomal protein S5-alanine N-acetyltransferase [Luteibacter sp.]
MSEPIRMRTSRTVIRLLDVEEADVLRRYRTENREHLAPWEPLRTESHYTLDGCRLAIEAGLEAARADCGYPFAVLTPDSAEMIASFTFANVVRGVFQACHLGYGIARRHEGQGLMFEALDAAIRYAFGPLDFHRVMANHMPRNERSGRLLQRLGFEKEGYAKRYLKIDGLWEDHVLTAKVRAQG